MSKSTNFTKKPLVVAMGAAIAGAPQIGVAQEAEGSSGQLEEIIVTATRRESSMQDIPYNISALSGNAIEAQNMVDQNDVLRAMYGVTAVDRGHRNSGTVNNIVIRGLNVDNGANGDIMLNAVPTVATYYDNTPLFANFLVKDIDRVEVLRGPQGTLYGSGSLGGTVRYMTRRPDASGFTAEASVDYGQTSGSEGNNLGLDAMVNIPIGDRTAIRGVFSRIDNDGVIDYVNAYQLNDFREPLVDVNGTCTDPRQATDTEVMLNVGCFEEVEDADTVEIDYARLALRSDITDNFAIQLTYHTQSDEIGARRSTTLGDNAQDPSSPLYFEYGDDDSGQVILEPSTRDADLAALDIEWDMGFATFTSSTSAYNHEGVGESDNGGLWASGGEVDGTSRDWNFNFYGGGWPRPIQRAERGYDDEALIQEFRLVSNDADSKLQWLAGIFYMDQDTSVYQLSHNPGMNLFKNACNNTGDPVCDGFWPTVYAGDLTEIDFEYIRDTSYEETAVYGELTYNFTDNFSATGGFRWFTNDTVNDVVLGFPLGPGATSPSAPTSTDSDDDVLFKVNLAYNFGESTMAYATWSEGYRHGGAQSLPSVDNGDPFGEPNADAVRTFDSDAVTNYEIGIKGGGNSFRYTAALFSVDWENPQLNTTSAWWGFYIAANGTEANTSGVELEFEGFLGDAFHYRLGYTYVRAELTQDFMSPQTGDLVAPDGASLPGAPENTLSASADYTWNFSNGLDFVLGMNIYAQSEVENFIDQDDAWNETFDSYVLVGAQAALHGESWTAMLYGRNLTDESGASGGFPTSYWSYDTGEFENWYGNGNRQFIVQPQTIGLKLTYRFE